MLDFPTQDPDDKELLQESYDALHDQGSVTVVSDAAEKKMIFQEISSSLSLSPHCAFTCANLFRIRNDDRQFYIAQCLEDYRFTINSRGMISDRYIYRIVGFYPLESDHGKILLRPETKSDKVVGRFFRSDIEIGTNVAFNKRYYIATDDEQKTKEFFNENIANVLSKTRDVYLMVNKRKAIVSFENELSVGQTVLAGSILRAVRG